jgi:transposase
MRAYPLELRRRAIVLLAGGWSVPEVARHLGVSDRTIQRYRARAAQGCLTPTPIPGRSRRLTPTVTAALANHVRLHPQATLDELRTWLRSTHGIEVSSSTVWRSLHRLGFRRMPRPRVRPSPID